MTTTSMSIITKKSLSRRAVLRGLGVSLALPLLDSMMPAFAATRVQRRLSPLRLGVVYVPNGMMMANWTPKGEGAAFEVSPILQPLAPFRDQLLVVSGLDNKPADPLPGEGTGSHARGAGAFLTVSHPKRTEGVDIRAGLSMDQLAAKQMGRETQLASLELALESVELLGSCDSGYSCAYSSTVSWRTETTPMPMENDPRAVFERLLGDADSTDIETRRARIRRNASLLDSITGEASHLAADLGARDRNKLSEYLESVRDVERRIQKAEEQSERELPTMDQPAGIPSSYDEHAKLMFDLLALAYQADLTRVGTFMMAREVSPRPYPEIGVPDGHHPVSHHQNDPEKLAKLAKINTYHMTQCARFIEKLRATPDGDGSLLDHSMIMYGAGISDSNVHLHYELPIALIGGGGGTLKGGRHLRYPKDTPLANLYITMLDKLGVSVEKLGDSTGKLDALSEI